jgi:hypothetical protein
MIQKAYKKPIRLLRAAEGGSKDHAYPAAILIRYFQTAITYGLDAGGNRQARLTT